MLRLLSYKIWWQKNDIKRGYDEFIEYMVDFEKKKKQKLGIKY